MTTSASWPPVISSSAARCEPSGWNDDRVLDAEVFAAEIQAALDHVHDDGFHIHQLEELKAGEADRAGADDQHGFARLRVGALDGVVADGEGFDQRELVIG